MRLDEAADIAAMVKEWLNGPVYVVGSIRRKRAIVSNIDLLTLNQEDYAVLSSRLPSVPITQAKRDGQTMWAKFDAQGMDDKIEVRLFYVPPESLGPGLVHFTGSEGFTRMVRGRAARENLHLTQYGLFTYTRARLDDNTEQGVFRALGMAEFQRPESRERS